MVEKVSAFQHILLGVTEATLQNAGVERAQRKGTGVSGTLSGL